MSNGVRVAADEFGRATAKIAVAQLCDAVGFHCVKDSALESFTGLAIKYLVDLGRTAEFHANLAGRSQCSVFDLILALEDLEAPQGFSSNGGGMREIMNYVESAPEIPFSHPIPQFPVIREMRIIPSFTQIGETPPAKHIPHWLPALPDPHTYIHTPMWDERVSDPRDDKIEQARQRRKAERSLLSLQKRLLLCNRNNRNGSVETSTTTTTTITPATTTTTTSAVPAPVVITTTGVGSDPEGVDKDVSPIDLPSRLSGVRGGNRVSVLEAFAPAIEMLGSGGGLCDDDDGFEGRTVLPAAVRPTVHFKFRIGKKLIGESFDDRHQKKDASRAAAALAAREDERDDKKRRAEYILRQSMENPQELTLL